MNNSILTPTISHTLYAFLVGVLVILSGCSGGYAPVTEQSILLNRQVEIVRSQDKNQSFYRVKSGDTLYSIAWRYGLDYRVLAQMNGIGSDYRIYSGQTLNLKTESAVSTRNSAANTGVSSERANSAKETHQETAVIAATDKQQQTMTKTQTVTANKELSPIKETVKKDPAPTETVSLASKDIVWRWPVSGRLLKGFSANSDLNKGIDLDGKMGDPVYAAAAGKVVYAGSGLLGYGNLIIINHNQEYLSAYAHNSRILATENDNVNVGQKIAEIGNSGAARTMLHFEIRKDGKPVNPLKYLPNR